METLFNNNWNWLVWESCNKNLVCQCIFFWFFVWIFFISFSLKIQKRQFHFNFCTFLNKCCNVNGTSVQCTSFRFRYLYEKDDVIGLEIRKVEASDEGEYKCVAFNKSGKAECKCNIYVDGRLHCHCLLSNIE